MFALSPGRFGARSLAAIVRPLKAVKLPYVALAALGIGLLHVHISGAGTFLGDSDRLDTFLSIREFQVSSIQQSGYVPAWNQAMFMGFDVAGIYWMLPVADPVAYVEALFPLRDLVRVSGFVTSSLIIFAAWSAYLYFESICKHQVAAGVGSALYVCSAFSIGRITQVDPAFEVLVYAPLGLLALRRIGPVGSTKSFIGLALVLTAMLWTTFLQDAAYAFLLFGCYAAYRGLVVRSTGPLVTFVLAILIAALAAIPRLYNVFQDIQIISRTPVNVVPCPCELLRWFDDGLYGRFPQEVMALGNRIWINLHEGAQIYTATFAPLLIVVGALQMRGAYGGLAALLFFATLGLLSAPLVGNRIGFTLTLGAMAIWGCWAWSRLQIRRRDSRGSHLGPVHDSDGPFYLTFLAVGLAVILWPPARQLLQLAFFGLDFNHSRISVATVLAVCALVSMFLAERLGPIAHLRASTRGVATIATAAALAVVVVLSIDAIAGLSEAYLGLTTPFRLGMWAYLVPAELLKLGWSTFVFGVLVIGRAVLAKSRRVDASRPSPEFGWPGLRAVPGYVLALVMLFQAFRYAEFQLNGPQTETFPVPFKDNNYFNAPPGDLRPPSLQAVGALSERLETDQYRSVLISAPDGFPAYDTPSEHGYTAYLAHAWHLRLVDGYPTLPRRIAALPWPPAALSIRSLSFRPETQLPWPLLAVLNVKYAVTVNPALYFNNDGNNQEAHPDDIVIEENPLPVVPRQFFAESVRPSFGLPTPAPPLLEPGADVATGPFGPVPAPVLVEAMAISSSQAWLSWADSTLGATYRIELRKPPSSDWRQAATATTGVRSTAVPGLDSLTTYRLRVQACTPQGCSPYSEVASIATPSSLDTAELKGIVPADPTKESIVEGLAEGTRFSTEGQIRARYGGERVDVSVDPSSQPRFLVLNEMYNSNWKAFAGDTELRIYPTNLVMRGLVVPPGVSDIQMRFEPFMFAPVGLIFVVASGVLMAAALWFRNPFNCSIDLRLTPPLAAVTMGGEVRKREIAKSPRGH